MTTIHINGKIVSKDNLKNYEIVMEDNFRRVVSFRERKSNEKDKREETA